MLENTNIMTAQRPSFVLFDLGNVLVHISPEAFLQELGIDTPENRRFYQARVNEIVREYECGNDGTEEFLARLDRLFNNERGHTANNARIGVFSADDLRLAMLAVVGKPVQGMRELVARLRGPVPLGLLSNTNPLHYDWCMENLPVLQLIPSHFLSYKLGFLKPEARVFARVVETLRLPPGNILYIDDMPENIEAGRRAGLTCHLFLEHGRLEQELLVMDLL